jgi:hypothetical protein
MTKWLSLVSCVRGTDGRDLEVAFTAMVHHFALDINPMNFLTLCVRCGGRIVPRDEVRPKQEI